MRLTKRTADNAAVVCENCPRKGSCTIPSSCLTVMTNKLCDYEDAEEQGRLVILPKTLYEANDTPLIFGVAEWEVTGVRFYDGVVQAYTVKTKSVQTIIWGEEIGKTVFLSREEAEAALKGETNDV